MNILVFVPDYPNKKSNGYIFVSQLVEEFVRQGNNCSVIAPFSVTRYKSFHKSFEVKNGVSIYRPNYFSFSNIRLFGHSVTQYFRKIAIKRAIKKIDLQPDIIYCHFWNSAMDAFASDRFCSVPMFVACGESDDWLSTLTIEPPLLFKRVTGVICVSSNNRDCCFQRGFTDAEHSIVLPNSVDVALFRKLDKDALRQKYRISPNDFIVAFVGAFNTRKGVQRVSAAIDKLGDKNVKSFFIGKGGEGENLRPSCKGILFEGPVDHNILPEYLNMADVFVVPTLHEGCCNAIVEALACGVPVISSNRPFNTDVLDSSNSILVEPEDIQAIANAIETIKNDKNLQASLSEGALISASELTIVNRAKRILSFISEKLNNGNSTQK